MESRANSDPNRNTARQRISNGELAERKKPFADLSRASRGGRPGDFASYVVFHLFTKFFFDDSLLLATFLQ